MVEKWIKEGADETLENCVWYLERAIHDIARTRVLMKEGILGIEEAMNFTAQTLANLSPNLHFEQIVNWAARAAASKTEEK